VGYVVSAQEAMSPSALRRYLQQRLPDYMVPASFVMLDALPLTPNGKVDRRGLPAPEGNRAHLETTFVSPKTPIQRMLADIWKEVLGIEQVGIHDNFFDLGGHSLLATQVLSRLRVKCELNVPIQLLFELPTIDGLSGTLSFLLGSKQHQENLQPTIGEQEMEIEI
jgi:surfactin family lipopeptide synthetase A